MILMHNPMFLGFIALWFVVPPLLVALSAKVHGGGKLGWALASLVFSWVGYAVFLVAATNRHEARS